MPFMRNVIYQGHVLDILRTWPANIINCVVTSPPYWVQRLYTGLTPQIWGGKKHCHHDWREHVRRKSRGGKGESSWERPSRAVHPDLKDTFSLFCSKCPAWRGDLGNEPLIKLYVDHIAQVFDEVKRVLRKDGTLWLNLSDSYYGSGFGSAGKQSYLLDAAPSGKFKALRPKGELPNKCLAGIPFRVVLELVNRGWVHRQTVIWEKPNALPESVTDRPTVNYEYVFMLTKNPKYYYEQQFEPIKESTITRGKTHRSSKDRSIGLPPVGGHKFTSLEAPYSMKYSGKRVEKRPYRNLRSVWRIPISRFPNATDAKLTHFAVFPTKLIERPIKASCPKQVCQTCGKPRVAKYRRVRKKEPRRYGQMTLASETGGLRVDDWVIQFLGYTGCRCANYVKGIVLDPFMGSGTTALVSKALGRDWVGIELSDDYVSLAYKRLTA